MPPREKGAPDQIKPKHLGDYLEVMSKAVFQAGMSWDVVESKWPGTREAFHDFDMDKIAMMGEPDVEALTQDTRVIRNRRKLEAIVTNAAKLVELDAKYGTFPGYLRSHGNFDSTVADMRKQFTFLGDMGCYYFPYVVGEKVPPHEEFEASRRK